MMYDRRTTKTKPHNLIHKFEREVWEVIAEYSFDPPHSLNLLTEEEGGVYVSREDPTSLCCLVIGKESKFLYLVTAVISKDQKTLSQFRAKIVS